MRSTVLTVLDPSCAVTVTVAHAEDPYYRDIFPDTWVATDALGRTMPELRGGRAGEGGPAPRRGHLLHHLAQRFAAQA